MAKFQKMLIVLTLIWCVLMVAPVVLSHIPPEYVTKLIGLSILALGFFFFWAAIVFYRRAHHYKAGGTVNWEPYGSYANSMGDAILSLTVSLALAFVGGFFIKHL